MSAWQVQDAKARFSEFLKASLTEGPQVVTKRGIETAVLVPIEQWRRPQQATRPGLKELLLTADRRADIPTPSRGGGAVALQPHSSDPEWVVSSLNFS